ncbi:MAG: 4-(cytidine 5'-diphospho)-2-C-methyl-D-erythritol kinase [Puniceicoccaceae bacterium]
MLPSDQTIKLDCPAKLNLYLAILGKQADGFHALASVVAKTEFGDELDLSWIADGDCQDDRVELINSDFQSDDNTVNHAIRLFREESGITNGTFSAKLHKHIPSGAGFGGGSSDAVAALKAIQEIFPELRSSINWQGIAARIGSDCPLFFPQGSVLMEGRGERIIELGALKQGQLTGTQVILFKPAFSINTAEAYRRLAEQQLYQESKKVDADLKDWIAGNSAFPPTCNDFERLVETWMPSLDIVLKRLRGLNLDARMSGSGSACFVVSKYPDTEEILRKELEKAWGQSYWLVATQIQ